MKDCGCNIAHRVASTLAGQAIAALLELDPPRAYRLLRDSENHARRLRKACERGDHGPQEKLEYDEFGPKEPTP